MDDELFALIGNVLCTAPQHTRCGSPLTVEFYAIGIAKRISSVFNFQEIGMYIAPDLINSDNRAVALRHLARAGDTTFHLPLTRAKSGSGTLAISLTNEEQSRAEALAMINRRYAWRGYGSNHQFAGHSAETTFTARRDGHLISTVTLATDSESGLAVDQTFPEEMQFLRRNPNARLCELKKLAMEHGSDAKPVLAAMFHFVFIYGTTNYLGTDLVIEVNPRHAAFYERMLKFRRVGKIRTNISVNAPSQLMWLPVSEIESTIKNNADDMYEDSLYKYFYGDNIEERIINQLNERAFRQFSEFCYDPAELQTLVDDRQYCHHSRDHDQSSRHAARLAAYRSRELPTGFRAPKHSVPPQTRQPA